MQPDVSFLEGHDLAVYSAPWCGDCRRLKRFLDATGVAFREVDVEADPAAASKLESETGKRAIPFVLVNDQAWVRGYHRELTSRLDPRLLFDELRGALAQVQAVVGRRPGSRRTRGVAAGPRRAQPRVAPSVPPGGWGVWTAGRASRHHGVSRSS